MKSMVQVLAEFQDYAREGITRYEPSGNPMYEPGSVSRVASYIEAFFNQFKALHDDLVAKANSLMDIANGLVDKEQLMEEITTIAKDALEEYKARYKFR